MYSGAARLVRAANGAGMRAADEKELAGGEERVEMRVGGGEKPSEKRVRVGRAAPPASGSALLGGRGVVEEKRRGHRKPGDGAREQPASVHRSSISRGNRGKKADRHTGYRGYEQC